MINVDFGVKSDALFFFLDFEIIEILLHTAF
jgi:hypothetical protein